MRGIVVMAVAGVALAGTAQARHMHMRIPGSECSVFSHRPCGAAPCSVFDRHPCLQQPDYWIGEDLRLTIDSKLAYDYAMPDHDIDTISDLFYALRACWRPPAQDVSREGMQMSVRFSFKRDGELIAPPRVTYTTPDAPADTRQAYRAAIGDAFTRCAPLAFTKGLAGAIAGRPIAIRYVDDRDLEPQPEHP